MVSPPAAGTTDDEPIRLAPASRAQLRSARRLLRHKFRLQHRLFLADGPQAVREALARPGIAQELLVSDAGRHSDLVRAAVNAGIVVRWVADADLAGLSQAVSPQGVVAVCATFDADLRDVLDTRPRLVVCCAQVRDPGNAGTVIRCADAFGADAVVLTEGSVDLYNAKTVRASVGSVFHLPVVTRAPLAQTVTACRAAGMQVLAANGSGSDDLLGIAETLAEPTVWLLGNEAWGLPAEHLSLADRAVRVPLYGAAESLNLSTAAAICLYTSATAQRRRP